MIIIVSLVLSYLSYVAALLLCYTFKINIFQFYSIYKCICLFFHQCILKSYTINFCVGFIKLCTNDFSRVSFAAELSTKLVYNSVFVKYYDYIYMYIY